MNNQDNRPIFSIIVAVHDQAADVEKNLPAMLTQEFDSGYEVVVVDESSTDETPDILKTLKEHFPHLYTTFVPKYRFQQNKRRLALTIGVKAAKGAWVVFIDASTTPPSPQWLAELAEFAQSPNNLLTGYINRKNGNVRLRTYEEVAQARKTISRAERWRKGKNGKWKMALMRECGYDFVVVRTELGHETLKLF